MASDYPYIKDIKNVFELLYGIISIILFHNYLVMPGIHAYVTYHKRANWYCLDFLTLSRAEYRMGFYLLAKSNWQIQHLI